MGNRAVITSKIVEKVQESNQVGIYLHWNGGRDSVDGFLTYCKLRGFSDLSSDYGMARLTQVISNFFGGSDSIGVGPCNQLDCDNYDNGVYFVENFKIIGREYFKGSEQKEYELLKMLISIDQEQPTRDQIGEEKIKELLKTL